MMHHSHWCTRDSKFRPGLEEIVCTTTALHCLAGRIRSLLCWPKECENPIWTIALFVLIQLVFRYIYRRASATPISVTRERGSWACWKKITLFKSTCYRLSKPRNRYFSIISKLMLTIVWEPNSARLKCNVHSWMTHAQKEKILYNSAHEKNVRLSFSSSSFVDLRPHWDLAYFPST